VERNLFRKERKRTKKKEMGRPVEMTSMRKSERQDFLIDLKKPAGFFTFPQALRRSKQHTKGWAKSDDQSGPNQVDKTSPPSGSRTPTMPTAGMCPQVLRQQASG
jgi:hypothetical protein